MNLWSLPPNPVPPLGANVHVWVVELDEVNFDGAVWHARLSPEEQARAARFKFDRDRRRFIVAHAALRDILAGYVNADAARLEFVHGPNGKPQLAPPLAESNIKFNLSHSHKRALLAVSHGREIGIDIEFVRPDFAFHEVADHFFTAREVAGLRALPTALQRQGFYKCWTSKEAFLKAKGTGLSGKLDEVEITVESERVRIEASVTGWSLTELDPGEGCQAALVSETPPMEIFCYCWRPTW
jgi:4'-phosphopantetheinyl transferase